MAEENPYEEWKRQGRPEGSFENWMASQNGPPPEEQQQEQPQSQPQQAGPAPTGGKQWNWTPDSSAAQKAYKSWGSPNLGGVSINDWFKSAVEDGVFLQNGESSSDTAYNKSGYSKGGADITGMRAYAKANGMSEDFDRWDEGQLMAWEKQKDSNCPPNAPYQAFDGSGCIEKPIDSNNASPGDEQGGGGGNQGGGNGWGEPPPPPKPVTSGNQLSMTGNPMQDMLIGQFNTGKDPSTYQNNIFGLGEDMKVGGTGNNADGSKTREGQSLSGGGLWWGQDKETFGGFDASQKNAEGTASVSPAARAPAAPTPPVPPVSAPTKPVFSSRQGGAHISTRKPVPYQGFQNQQSTPISTMAGNQFKNPARNKPSYF